MIDADRFTCHIRCGSDIHDKLRAAGFTGDFLEYSDPVCEGPVPQVEDLPAVRARHLSQTLGRHLRFTEAECLARLREAEMRLAQAHRYERVVLWFEHDSYDQLVLARCLSGLAEGPRPDSLELICIDRHPDVARFIGLGQLQPDALAELWRTRRPVTPAQIGLYREIWDALRHPDPTALYEIAGTGTPDQPIAAPALWRHLQELPSVADGLSLTQRLILTVLSDRRQRVSRICAALVQEHEPLVFLGDASILATVEAMAHTSPPVLTIAPATSPLEHTAEITDIGRRVLSGTTDYLALNPSDRWIGGVPANGRWRWDDNAHQVVQSGWFA